MSTLLRHVNRADAALLGAPPPQAEPPLPRPEPARRARQSSAATVALPNRYRIREENGERSLACVEAPTLRVRIERDFSVTESAARTYPPGSIFLDGAAQAPPFVDPERAIYNLDHHEGCVRAFTLAACEQALVLIRRGMDLRKRDWTVYANGGDLDTVLAIWVLLNHLHLADRGSAACARMLPLLRLQGVIDAQGLELEDLCAFPPDLHARTRGWMDKLRAREVALRGTRDWEDVDLLRYTADRLRLIDSLAYPLRHFAQVDAIEELSRIEIARDSVAIVCRSRLGVYEAERELRRLHGARLGLIVLETATGIYTLRQVDPTLPVTLGRVYDALNLLDPASAGAGSDNRWGGSAEIGGSPRRTGSALDPGRIAKVCQQVYRGAGLVARAHRILRAALLALVLLLGARVLATAPTLGLSFAAALTLLSGVLYLTLARRAPGLYANRRPHGVSWVLGIPLVAAGGLASGAWAAAPTALPVAELLVLPVGIELLFRGLIPGGLAHGFRLRPPRALGLLSVPLLISSLLYAGAHAAVLGSAPLWAPLLFALGLGLVRERAESCLPCFLLHGLALTLPMLVALLLP